MSGSNNEGDYEDYESVVQDENDYNKKEEYHGKGTETAGKGSDDTHVKIALHGANDNRTVVLAKKTTKINRLLNAYCKERGVSPKEYRLIYKGKVLQEAEEISTYNMASGDVIEVVASQTGGSLSF